MTENYRDTILWVWLCQALWIVLLYLCHFNEVKTYIFVNMLDLWSNLRFIQLFRLFFLLILLYSFQIWWGGKCHIVFKFKEVTESYFFLDGSFPMKYKALLKNSFYYSFKENIFNLFLQTPNPLNIEMILKDIQVLQSTYIKSQFIQKYILW